jgi:hypothetical protein
LYGAFKPVNPGLLKQGIHPIRLHCQPERCIGLARAQRAASGCGDNEIHRRDIKSIFLYPQSKERLMTTRASITTIVATVLLSSMTVGPIAAQPETQTPPGPAHIRKCGVTITEPGAYVLQGNLSSSSPHTCITIESRYVTLDLAGFAIIGSGDRTVPTYRGIHVEPNLGFEGITVRNGSIQHFYDGVSLEGAAGSNVENVRSVFNHHAGISLHTGIAKNNTLWANGIGVRCVAALVVQNAFKFGNGIQIQDVFGNCTIIDNAL